MISLRDEQLLSFSEASKKLPGRPAISTLHRWRQNGIHGIKLETCLLGGKRYTSEEALQRFANAVTSTVDNIPIREPTNCEIEVERQLDQLGL